MSCRSVKYSSRSNGSATDRAGTLQASEALDRLPDASQSPDTDTPCGLTRRGALVGGVSLVGWTLLGCERPSEPEPVPSQSTASSVPLRVTIIGDSASGEYLERTWAALDATPLAIDAVAIDRTDAAKLDDELRDRMQKTDVVIYPLMAAGDLWSGEQIITLDLESLPAAEDLSSRLPSAVRAGVARFADQAIAVPLGGAIPAIFSVEAADEVGDWAGYDRLVDSWQGAASEPTAPGWAAAMYLWRAASTRETWLFDRESFEPTIAADAYVEILEQMVETHSRYQQQRLTPEAIWTAIQRAEMRGGITIPPASPDAFPDVQVQPLPSGDAAGRLLFDAFTPLASISAACRQSMLAKQLLAWLSTGDGTTAIAQGVAGVRRLAVSTGTDREAAVSKTPYDELLNDLWRTPLTRPTFQILNGGAYYLVLDEAIGEVLDGDAEPAGALERVAARWRELTEQAGVSSQIRLWHQAQGRRG